MSLRRLTSVEPRQAVTVSTIELLFDLVFVFVISQTTHAVGAHPTAPGLARSFITLGLVWWIYHGYAWLTNLVAPHSTFVRLTLIAAMAGFLCIGLALPDAFGDAGLVFGVAYLVVTVLHSILLRGVGGSADGGRVLWFNVAGACALLIAGFVVGPLDWVLFLVPFGFFALSAREARRSELSVGASHFVERHGLFMLIAFGETIVSVGSGLDGGHGETSIGPRVVTGALASVALVGALWWTYFSSPDDRAEETMDRLTPRRRTVVGLTGYGICHLVMLFGLTCMAAGVAEIMVDAFAPVAPVGAALLVGGVASYLLANGEFRRELHLRPTASRAVAAAVCLATFPAHRIVPGVVLVIALAVIIGAMLTAENRLSLSRNHPNDRSENRPGGRPDGEPATPA